MNLCICGFEEVICIVEYSFSQFVGVCGSIMEFCENRNFSFDQLEQLRIVLEDPQPNGLVTFHVGVPCGAAHKS